MSDERGGRAAIAVGALAMMAVAAQPMLNAGGRASSLLAELGMMGLTVAVLGTSHPPRRLRLLGVAAALTYGGFNLADAFCLSDFLPDLSRVLSRLTTGKAVGIDLWAAKDLSNNNAEATRANAAAEGVADRVEVDTGDITALAYPDATFDAVISMTVIHNIPSRDARDQALRELVRVLKPGGRIALFDLLHTARYNEVLREAGMTVRDLGYDLMWFLPCHTLLAQKPIPGEP